MFLSRALKGILALSLFICSALQAQQPVNLDDDYHTFSSMKIAAPAPQTRNCRPYLASGVLSCLLGGICGITAGAVYFNHSTLPWWDAQDKAVGIARSITLSSTIFGLYAANRAIQREQDKAAIRARIRGIVGDASFLEAIQTDNVEHMKAWLAYDKDMLDIEYGKRTNKDGLEYESLLRRLDSSFRTSIMIATLANSTNVLKLLLVYCAEQRSDILNAQDHQGNTALHKALENNNFQASQLLLKYGADTSLKNHAGKTAIDLVPQEWSPAAASALGISQNSAYMPTSAQAPVPRGITLKDVLKIGGCTAAMAWLIGQWLG